MKSSVDQQQHNHALLMNYTEFFRILDTTQLTKLSSIYHQDVQFINPVMHYQGIDAFQRYYSQLLHAIGHCRFEMEQGIMQDDCAAISWHMNYTHAALNNGQQLELKGATHVRFRDGLVVYQHDYFDLGAMLYEHVPMVGPMVKALKAKLST